MRVELGLAWAGVRHRPASWILLAVGVAIAVALPVFAAGLRLEASTAAVRSAIDALPPASRAVLAVTSTNLLGAELAQASATVDAGFRAAALVNTRQTVTFRPLAFGGQDLIIGGGRPSWPRMYASRPDACRASAPPPGARSWW